MSGFGELDGLRVVNDDGSLFSKPSLASDATQRLVEGHLGSVTEVKPKPRRSSKKKKKKSMKDRTRRTSDNHFIPTSILTSSPGLSNPNQNADPADDLPLFNPKPRSIRQRRNSRRTVMKRPLKAAPINSSLSMKSLKLFEDIDNEEAEIAEVKESLANSKKREETSLYIAWKEADSFPNLLQTIEDGAEAVSTSGLDAPLSFKQIAQMCKLLLQNTSCTKISMANAKCKDKGTLALSHLVHKQRSLTYLHLWGNMITDKGAEYLASALQGKVGSCLESLILSRNQITEVGAEALCLGLKTNRRLLFLDMGENKIEDAGALYFARLLKQENRTLERLDLSDNNITEFGARALARAVKANPVIQELTLAFNAVMEDGTEKMQSIGFLVFSVI